MVVIVWLPFCRVKSGNLKGGRPAVMLPVMLNGVASSPTWDIHTATIAAAIITTIALRAAK